MTPSSPPHRGAPLGNHNNFKHGFYSRRLKLRDLNGVDSMDAAGLLEEIALIRVFIRQLVESFDPQSDYYERADFLRTLCLASLAITRVIKTQYFLSTTGSSMDDEITEAIRQVNQELRHKNISPAEVLPEMPSQSTPPKEI
jgi:hypothetical protein